MKRREFVKYFSLGVIGPAFTNFLSLKKKSVQHLIPYVIPPVGVVPGVANWYSSVCRQCSAGCGIQVRVREGRAKKIEGTPSFPVNQGKLCARGQAGLQVLYNPDRITSPMVRTENGFKKISWDKAEQILADQLTSIRDKGRGERVVFLTDPLRGSLARLISTFASSLGSDNFFSYEAFNDESLITANDLSFGYAGIPDYDLGNANYILSLGTNFLDTWTSPVKHSVGYGSMRDRGTGFKGHRGWLTHFEPRLSVTGANADEWVPVKPESEGLIALGLAHIIIKENLQHQSVSAVDGWKEALADFTPEKISRETGVSREVLKKVARHFAESESPIALCGGSATAQKNGIANAISANVLNYLVGSIGEEGGVRFPASSPLADFIEPTASHSRLEELSKSMGAGEVEAIFIRNVNPVFDMPVSYKFRENLSKVPLIVSFSSFMDETTADANLILPEPTYLESWDDYIPLTDDGRRATGLMQPTVNNLYNNRQMGDVLLSTAAVLGAATAGALPFSNYLDYLKDSWTNIFNDAKARGETAESDFEKFWELALVQGGWWSAKPEHTQPAKSPTPELLAGFVGEENKEQGETEREFHLWPYPSLALHDGRGANQPWLQQLPDPLITAAWGSWAEINPETAKELDVKEGDLLEIESANGKISLPAYLFQAIEPKTIAVPVGQGHKHYGRYAKNVGENIWKILEPINVKQGEALAWASTKVKVTKGDGDSVIVKTEPDDELPGIENGVRELDREIVQWVNPEEGEKMVGQSLEPIKALPTRDLREGPHLLSGLGLGKYQESKFYKYKYRWGMVIDLDKCTGCSACMVACYAENNLPLVDAKELEKRRHKNWIRIDRYWEGEYPNVRAKMIPMNCLQCGNAPCEPVCPVYAAFHTVDGLNGQVYQRCVGTRYCNANCPYRSRLFNWFNSEWPEPLNHQLNPDISIRTSGVTDKCSFCVQRIRAAKDTAKDENRKVQDGEIQTACAQTCPTGAITFGNLLDPNSKVSVLTKDPRRYRVLEEINTEPAVIHLKAVRKGAEEEHERL